MTDINSRVQVGSNQNNAQGVRTGAIHNFNPNGPATTEQPTPENEMKMMNDYNADAKSQASKKSHSTRTGKKMKKGKTQRMVSFREMREVWRQKEVAHLGPGAHDFGKSFGSDLQNISFGSKYIFKPDQNPGPGLYDPELAMRQVSTKSYETFIKQGRKSMVVEHNPDAGAYNPYKQFGDLPQKMTIGGKYKFKPDSNPPPGYYNPEYADSQVMRKSASFRQSSDKRSKMHVSDVPDAGMYEPHKHFGSIPQKMTIGGKYKWKADSNPPPGFYDPMDKQTKNAAPSHSMKKEKKSDPFKSVKNDPSPGQYDGHLIPFSKDLKNNMTWQGKYEFKPNSNPPPGLYDPDRAVKQIKPTSSSFVAGTETRAKPFVNEMPDAGQYEPHKPFGTIPQNMTIGGKYKWKADSNPPPGFYDPSDKQTTSTAPSHSMKKEKKSDPFKSVKNDPAPGQYDGHLIPFSKDIKNNMTWQGKYEFKPNSNPPPGLYDPDRADSQIKPKSAAYSPSKETRAKPFMNDMPDAGQYEPHKVFGDIPQNMTIGGPYKWKASDTPGPGTYEAEMSKDSIMSRSPSTKYHNPYISVKKQDQPTPQVYDAHLKPFAADVNDRAVWGGKYKFSVNDVPPPGYYNPEQGDSQVRERSPCARIHEETMVAVDEPEAIPVYTKSTKN